MNRKYGLIVGLAVILVLVFAVAVSAQGARGNGQGQNQAQAGPRWQGSGPQGMMGNGYGPGAGECENFVDEDGDGICDLAAQDGTGQQYGRGMAHMAFQGRHGGRNWAQQRGMGQGQGFEDGDGDGVCDHFLDEDGDGINDAAPQDGTGNQYRHPSPRHGRR